jgi:asparaginyl-tRNA synthetase
MIKSSIAKLSGFVGQVVTLSGWVYHNRPSGKVVFLVIRDGTGLCQCVIEKGKVADAAFDASGRLGQESSLRVTGTVRAEPRSPGGQSWPHRRPDRLRGQDSPISPKGKRRF